MPEQRALSFAKDIRPMFTDLDIAHMKGAGMDLSDRDDVAHHAAAIYATVSEGSMPPENSGEARWTPEMCGTFNEWRDQGCPP
jgi:hypothetical protein